MNKANRKRKKAITIRMNDTEYSNLINNVRSSGVTQQSYIISAIHNVVVATPEEIAVLKEISITFSNLEKQLRGMATNVNQMAHVANGKGELPTEKNLIILLSMIKGYQSESERIWQSIRSSINQQRATEQ